MLLIAKIPVSPRAVAKIKHGFQASGRRIVHFGQQLTAVIVFGQQPFLDNLVHILACQRRARPESGLDFGKIIALPKVINKQGEMVFAEIDNLDNLKTGHFNIPEPITTVQARKADLVLVPGVVFSSKGKRIGQAGGFYDRFLENNHPYTIGVAYDFQMMNDIKTQPHDIDVCEVISNI